MREREKTYADYGITDIEKNELKNLCRKADKETYIQLVNAALEADKTIADDIVFSLVNGMSYEKLGVIKNIPCSRNTFYAVQIKTIYNFKKLRQ